jgi:hypothetical protein
VDPQHEHDPPFDRLRIPAKQQRGEKNKIYELSMGIGATSGGKHGDGDNVTPALAPGRIGTRIAWCARSGCTFV